MVVVNSMIACLGNPKDSLKIQELTSQPEGLRGSGWKASFSKGVPFSSSSVSHQRPLAASFMVRSQLGLSVTPRVVQVRESRKKHGSASLSSRSQLLPHHTQTPVFAERLYSWSKWTFPPKNRLGKISRHWLLPNQSSFCWRKGEIYFLSWVISLSDTSLCFSIWRCPKLEIR